MASSASRQDEPNRALWLVTRAGKMGPSCPLGTTRKQNFTKSHIINPLLTKFARSRWLDIGLVLFCEFMDFYFVSVHKHAKKELGQYPAILTSHLVNNPYVYWFTIFRKNEKKPLEIDQCTLWYQKKLVQNLACRYKVTKFPLFFSFSQESLLPVMDY